MGSVISRAAQDRRAVFCVVALVTVLLFVSHLQAYDLWWHLKAGDQILKSARVPHSDPFSFTAADRPWTYHSWLSGVILYLVHSLGGGPGLIVLRALFNMDTSCGASLRTPKPSLMIAPVYPMILRFSMPISDIR